MPNNWPPDGPMVKCRRGFALCTMSLNRSRTFEYLLQGIGWSHTSQEFERLERFARAHYTGPQLKRSKRRSRAAGMPCASLIRGRMTWRRPMFSTTKTRTD